MKIIQDGRLGTIANGSVRSATSYVFNLDMSPYKDRKLPTRTCGSPLAAPKPDHGRQQGQPMRHSLLGGALASACGMTTAVAAQNPQTQPPRTPTPQEQPRTQGQGQVVTVEVCVMREADVPGRKPNVAERAGIAEDYILTSTRPIQGSKEFV